MLQSLTEQNQNTQHQPVTWVASLGSFLGFIFKGSIKKALQADMEDLKQILESDLA